MDADIERHGDLVHHVVDCRTGAQTITPFTEAETAAFWDNERRGAELAAQKAQEDEQIKALVEAHSDPLVQLLARKAGLA